MCILASPELLVISSQVNVAPEQECKVFTCIAYQLYVAALLTLQKIMGNCEALYVGGGVYGALEHFTR